MTVIHIIDWGPDLIEFKKFSNELILLYNSIIYS